MRQTKRWAFVLDPDEFVRLSLSKILRKYGFEVEEIGTDLSKLEKRRKQIEAGIILADMEMDLLEKSRPVLTKWSDRIIVMTPLVTDELRRRLKEIGVRRIIKKPVEPRTLRRVIRGISLPAETKSSSSGKRGEGSRFNQKGGEGT
jgi:DNA-binding response OmpR family regulator